MDDFQIDGSEPLPCVVKNWNWAPCKEEQKRKRENEDVDIVFGVTDLDGLYEAITAKDVDIVQPLRVMPYGKEFYIRDPDGNILAFFDVTS